jgi:large subunit ribosomal protein L29
MDIKDLRSLSKEELQDRIKKLRKDLFELNSQRKYGKVEKPHLFKENKKQIARILTILKESKTGAVNEEE